MKISESWVRSWTNPDIDTKELVAQLTMAGLEVDAVEPVAKPFDGVVVGEIISTEQHPDADKLRICQVNAGGETLQIVCGASNARDGLRAPLAKVGAILPGDFKIKAAKLRGVESQGMLCAREELGVSGDSAGLWELSTDAPIGDSLRDYLALDDQVIEIDLTPNRADCLSIRGVSREIGVLNRCEISEPVIEPVSNETDIRLPLQLKGGDACPVYIGRVIEDIDPNAQTPSWMVERLARSDIGTIHPVVDVTNYVMMELGQPMHGFDLDKLKDYIEVRLAKKGEKVRLLDDKEHELDEGVLVIADASGPVAMAGIMGGKDSGVTETTTNVFLESAFFHPLAITGKAREYGLHTDSSHRFERGVDPTLQDMAIERATALLLEIVGGKPGPLCTETLDDQIPAANEIELRCSRIERLIGCAFEYDEVEDILRRLGIEILGKDESGWKLKAPSWRFDMEIEEDLIEEVARVYGYDRLPERTLLAQQPIGEHNESVIDAGSYKEMLVSRGFREIISYSFISPDIQKNCFPNEAFVPVQNPIAEDMSVMRTSLIPGLLASAQYNLNRQQSDLSLFESGMVFSPKEHAKTDGLLQLNRVSGLMTGRRAPESWANSSDEVDFYDIKHEVALLLAEKEEHSIDFVAGVGQAVAHPGQSARVLFNGESAGWLGKLHPQIQATLDIDQAIYVFELDEQAVIARPAPKFKPLSKFPGVRRDIALVVDKELAVSELIKEARQKCGELLTEARIFDIYHGQGIDSNEKSVGIGLTFRDYSRTLNDEIVTQQVAELVEHLSSSHNARQR